MNLWVKPTLALVFLGCAAFVVGKAPVDDDDFVFEGSGYGLLNPPESRSTVATPASTTTAAPTVSWTRSQDTWDYLTEDKVRGGEDESSGSGQHSDDESDYDYYDYEDEENMDYLEPIDHIDDKSTVMEVPKHVGGVHNMPPPAPTKPARRPSVGSEHEDHSERRPAFGAEFRPPAQTPAPELEYPDEDEELENDITLAPELELPDNSIEDNTIHGLGAKAVHRNTSFFAQPGILAAVVGGAVVGLLCAILLVMLIVYRMRKKDEGSYPLDEPKRSLTGNNSYSKNYNKEFYA